MAFCCLPLEAIPETLAKLCSAHPLTWADLAAAYAAPGASKLTAASDDMVGYLTAHGVTAKLNAAVNKLATERPDDAMAFLIAELEKAKAA